MGKVLTQGHRGFSRRNAQSLLWRFSMLKFQATVPQGLKIITA